MVAGSWDEDAAGAAPPAPPVRPLRVCLVTGEYPPDEGGVADYTALLAEGLARRGHAVAVLTSTRGRPGAGGAAAKDGPLVLRSMPRWDIWTLRRVAACVARIRPDVVHLQYQTAAFNLSPWVNAVPWWLRRQRRWITAVTYHDLLVPYLFPKAGPLRPWVTWLPARYADVTVATTAADAQRLDAHGARNGATVIPIGSNVPAVPPAGFEAEAWRRDHGLGGAAVLAYFGMLNRSKGALDLVAALEGLVARGTEAHLVMVGAAVGTSDATNARYRGLVESALEERGLRRRVTWTGHVPAEEVAAWLRAAHAVVLPYADGASYRRGSLLAALANGAAIVTTRPAPGAAGGGLPTLEHGRAALLVAPGDVAATVAAVARILEDPPLAAALGRGARALAAAFGWEGITRRHVELYRRALGPSPGKA